MCRPDPEESVYEPGNEQLGSYQHFYLYERARKVPKKRIKFGFMPLEEKNERETDDRGADRAGDGPKRQKAARARQSVPVRRRK